MEPQTDSLEGAGPQGLDEIPPDMTADVVQTAAQRRVPVTITVRDQNRWLVYHSHVLHADGRFVWIELPAPSEGVHPKLVLPKREVGLSFRLVNYHWADHRYFMSAPVVAMKDWPSPRGELVPAVLTRYPKEIHGLGRRAYARTDVPADRVVRVTVWPGGRLVAPEEDSPQRPVWSGRVTDLSAGGFQMRTHRSGLNFYQAGDLIGVAMKFEDDGELILADAQYRHGEDDGAGMALLGFCFVGLDQDPDSIEMLERVIRKVAEYQGA